MHSLKLTPITRLSTEDREIGCPPHPCPLLFCCSETIEGLSRMFQNVLGTAVCYEACLLHLVLISIGQGALLCSPCSEDTGRNPVTVFSRKNGLAAAAANLLLISLTFPPLRKLLCRRGKCGHNIVLWLFIFRAQAILIANIYVHFKKSQLMFGMQFFWRVKSDFGWI